MQIHYYSHYIAHTPTEDSIFPDEDDIVQISTTTTYDVAVFNNIEATVE